MQRRSAISLSTSTELRKPDKIRILGVDPGTRATGYAILEIPKSEHSILKNSCSEILDLGCIRPPADRLLSDRYAIIYEGIDYLIQTFQPDEVAIETPFVHKNMQSALKLGAALASIILAAKKHKLSTFGYPPREIKLAVCGRGGASKEEVALASRRYVRIQAEKAPIDALDALAIAITHSRFPGSGDINKHPKLI